MRELTQLEITAIAFGINCVDVNLLTAAQQQAIRDGVSFSLITGALSFGIAYGIFASPYIGVGVSLVLAPYAAGLGYFSSSAWTLAQ